MKIRTCRDFLYVLLFLFFIDEEMRHVPSAFQKNARKREELAEIQSFASASIVCFFRGIKYFSVHHTKFMAGRYEFTTHILVAVL